MNRVDVRKQRESFQIPTQRKPRYVGQPQQQPTGPSRVPLTFFIPEPWRTLFLVSSERSKTRPPRQHGTLLHNVIVNIYLSRDSVCAGDDGDAPHSKQIIVADGASIEDILSNLSHSVQQESSCYPA